MSTKRIKGFGDGVNFCGVVKIREAKNFLTGDSYLPGEIDWAGVRLDHGVEKQDLSYHRRRKFYRHIARLEGRRSGEFAAIFDIKVDGGD